MLERKASAYSLLQLLNVKLACMPSCVRPEVRLPFDQKRILCSDCCEKMHYASPSSLLAFCTAQKQDTFGAYEQSYAFAQPAVLTARWDYQCSEKSLFNNQ